MLEADVFAATIPPAVLPVSERAELAAALARRPPPAVRLRPGVGPEALPSPSKPVPWHPRGRLLPGGVRPGGWSLYGTGAYYVQDAGSLLALALVGEAPAGLVCDLCAAPGGKATGLAETLAGESWLLANEPVRSRVDVLAANLARHGSSRHVVTAADPQRLADRLGETFATVLVDAPCSGQSLVGARRQSAAAFGEAAVSHNAARQRRILAAAARLTAPGGRLVYATCTFAVAENEAVVTDFLATRPGWRIDAEPTLTGYQSPLLPGSYRLWPHRQPTAGAFAVRLVRDDSGDDRDRSPVDGAVPRRDRRQARTPANRSRRDRAGDTLPEAAAGWGTWDEVVAVTAGPVVWAFEGPPPPAWRELAVRGPEAAYLKGRTWFPAYGLALRRDGVLVPRRVWDLDSGEAAAYLRGEPVGRSEAGEGGGASGWGVARWERRPLGWVKADRGWLKNHLPKPLTVHVATEAWET